MVGGALGLGVTCLPPPQSGLKLAYRFEPSGVMVTVRAFGLTRMAAKHPHCYNVLACRVPARDYAQVASQTAGHLELDLVATGAASDVEASRNNWTGFTKRLRLPVAPYAATRHGHHDGPNIALTLMIKNAVRSGHPQLPHGASLIEWLEYHRLLGVGRFYVYDNGSTDRTKALLQSYASAGVVWNIRDPVIYTQIHLCAWRNIREGTMV